MAPHLFSTIFGRYGMQKDVWKAPCFGFSSMVLFFLTVVLLLAVPRGVCAEETVMTEELSMEIRNRLEHALEAGETEADLSDLNLIMNMYSDRFGEPYKHLLDLCDAFKNERCSFVLGSHKEPYVDFTSITEPTEGCNEYGVGPNQVTAIGLYYEEYYRYPDGKADVELISRVQETLTREYDIALSVVSEDMSDVEKALALYDYVITVSNYPDVQMINEDGIEVYDNESYSAVSVFRDHISVCIANATAYCYLLSDCGIPCVRVDSDEMQHSWVMLKVNGAWYHADPTWDNPRYMEGFTSCGDVNNDNWDLGAVSHIYFLKSDEEMENDLQHYGWIRAFDYLTDGSAGEVPVSGDSGSFDDTFFGSANIWQEEVHYNYERGEWYFLNRNRNQIVKTAYGQDMEKAVYIDAPSESLMKYVYSSGDSLFICDDNGIWRYDTVNGEMTKLDLAENENEEGIFTEMHIASGNLEGVVETDAFIQYSYAVEQLLTKESPYDKSQDIEDMSL